MATFKLESTQKQVSVIMEDIVQDPAKYKDALSAAVIEISRKIDEDTHHLKWAFEPLKSLHELMRLLDEKK